MELGSLEIQIFVSLVVVLGTAFIALICDFLKGNNEQLRERNLELRVRHEERDRLGLSNPAQWLQGLAALARNPQLAETMAAAAGNQSAPPAVNRVHSEPPPVSQLAPEVRPIATETEALQEAAPGERGGGSRRRYEEERGERPTAWASKEELEQLAERAARIRARHEGAQVVARHAVGGSSVGVVAAPAEPVRRTAQEPIRLKVLTFEKAPERLETREDLDLKEELGRVAALELEAPPAAEPAPFEAELEEPASVEPTIEATQPAPSEAELLETALIEPAAVIPPSVAAPAIDLPSVADSVPPAATVEPDESPTAEAAAEPEIWPVASSIPESLSVRHADPRGIPVVDPGVQPLWTSAPLVTPSAPGLMETVLEEWIEPAPDAAETPDSPAPLPAGLTVPAGCHDPSVLDSLMQCHAAYSGVIVAVGINDYDSIRARLESPAGAESLEAAQRMILSMLRPDDFACRHREDEFILLFPGENGASAQRRLFQVSEKLWDFQLRSLGSLSLMFSWGGYEVQGEPLSEAVASARDRMFQTRRTRTPAPLNRSMSSNRAVDS